MIPEGCFLFTKKEVQGQTSSELYGYGITNDSVIFNSEGLSEYCLTNETQEWPIEGRFCGIFVEKERIIIRTDKTGQDLLYFFESENDWAVSNSFLLLLKYASQQIKLTFLPEIAAGFHLKNGQHIGEQLISHQTMVEEIKVIPLTWELHICRETNEVEFEKFDYLNRFKMPQDVNYEQTITDVLQDGAGILTALSQKGYTLNPHLSGGYDSRLVMCMLSIANINRNINVSSYEHKVDDFQSAQKICEHFNLPLNQKRILQKNYLSAGEALRAYLMSCGGTYLPFYAIHDFKQRSPVEVVLTGDQPTGWSFFAGNAQFNGNAAKIGNDIVEFLGPQPYGEKLRHRFLTTFEILGIEQTHPAAMLAHYNAIRSRYHCGRNWYKSMGSRLLFTPLMDSRFIAMDLHNLEHGHHPTKVFVDAFLATGEWALSIPFETPERKFDEDLVKNSPFREGANLTPNQFTVYGTPYSEERNDSPDIYDIPTEVGFNDQMMKQCLERTFYAAKLAKKSEVFTDEDIQMALEEIRNSGNLSHGYRKLMHIIFVDMVLRSISSSKEHIY